MCFENNDADDDADDDDDDDDVSPLAPNVSVILYHSISSKFATVPLSIA